LAGFYYDYTNLQQTTIVQVNNVPTQIVSNAAQSEIYGAEFNGTFRVTPEFSLTTGLTYLHARYNKYPGAVVLVPTGRGGNVQVTPAPDISGNTMIRAPEWSGNVTASYVADTAMGEVNATATVYASTKFFMEIGNRITQPGYALINASLGLKPKGLEGVEVSVWGKNLTNHPVLYGQNLSTNGDIVNYNLPATYGLELSYKF
jgi:iron complex outermembrane receptor protein